MILVTVMYEKLLMTGQNNGIELCKNVTTLYASYGHIDIAHVYRFVCEYLADTLSLCRALMPSPTPHVPLQPSHLSSLVDIHAGRQLQ